MSLRDAAQDALGALEYAWLEDEAHPESPNIINDLRDALAEAEKAEAEPVAWAISYDGKTPSVLWPDYDWPLLDLEVKRLGGTACKMPLYTHTPAALPELSDEDILLIAAQHKTYEGYQVDIVPFARAVLAYAAKDAVGGKN